jgi:rhamnulokinase
LVGTLVSEPIATAEALAARYTNQGAATGGFCFHTNVNGMWLLKQCIDTWISVGRAINIPELIQRASECILAGIINVDAEPLILSGDMPVRINHELTVTRRLPIVDKPGNEGQFARVIFESLAARYATALADLERMIHRKLTRIHMIGGASRNQLLADLTAQRTGLPVECGHAECTTIGNFALQLASSEGETGGVTRDGVRRWASLLSNPTPHERCSH